MEHLPHITEYKILSETEHVSLEKKIRRDLSNGWQPFGHLTVSAVNSPTGMPIATYAQAMVKLSEWYR